MINRRFKTVVTVRSEAKGDWILKSHPEATKENLSYVVVEDIAKDGAFDEVGPRCFRVSLSIFFPARETRSFGLAREISLRDLIELICPTGCEI